MTYKGIECCPNCMNEFDFTVDLKKTDIIKCTECGYEQHPCCLCDSDIVSCSEGNCKECLKKSLAEWIPVF